MENKQQGLINAWNRLDEQAQLEFIGELIMTSGEVRKFLNISNSRLQQLVATNRLKPIRRSREGSVFLASQIVKYKKAAAPFRRDSTEHLNTD